LGNFDASIIRDIVIVLVPMILSLSVHEFAHAWSAYKLGDDTAAAQGRMTLNPLAHIDLFGTILIPIFSVVMGGIGLIGWAKPVPVSPHRFRRTVTMRTGMMITAIAGPLSNLIMAFVTAGIVMLLFGNQIATVAAEPGVGSEFVALLLLGSHENADAVVKAGLMTQMQTIVVLLLGRIFLMNIGLAVFNMLPIPPLDGSRLLPFSWQEKLARFSMVAFIGFMVVINFAGGLLSGPVHLIGGAIVRFWSIFF
jgi:Zn-dependent protease